MNPLTRWLTIGLALALVASVAATGVYAYLYARQASSLETALASNKLLSAALDRVVAQAKIDERTVANFNRQAAEIQATLDQQQTAFRELANDPEIKDYLSKRVPSDIRELFEHR